MIRILKCLLSKTLPECIDVVLPLYLIVLIEIEKPGDALLNDFVKYVAAEANVGDSR